MIDTTRTETIPNILVVDDDPTSRLMLQSILRKEGFVVITASDGQEGRMLAEREQPDLILMDINMPVEDGLIACATLKLNAQTVNIPVVFISAVDDVASIIDGFNAGGVDYVTKPYQALEVIARVRLHIRLYHSYRSMMASNLEQLRNLTDAQKNILVHPEEYPEACFSVIYLPAQAAGGDFYDVIHSGAGIFDYIVADISGHHTGTSLPAAALKALLRQNSAMLYSPVENLNLVNRHLRPVLQEGQYATLIYARLNQNSMRLTVINAGHPSAIIVKGGCMAEVISQNGDGLGLFDNITLGINEIQMTRGDQIFLFSDGLIEQGPDGLIQRRDGLTNLVKLINQNRFSPIESIIATIRDALSSKADILSDDIVMLGFEVS